MQRYIPFLLPAALLFSFTSCGSYMRPYIISSSRAVEKGGEKRGSNPDPISIYHFIRGAIHASAWDPERAIEEYGKAILHDPYSPYLLTELASLYSALFKYDKAVEEVEKAIKISPEYTPARILLANIHEIRNEPERAEKEYMKVIEIDPSSKEGYLGLVNLNVKRGEYDRALDLLKELEGRTGNEVRKTRADILYIRARVLLQKKDEAGAERVLEGLIASEPEYYPAYEILTDILRGQGRRWKASEYYETLTTLYPDKLAIKNRLIDLYIETKRYEKALELALELEGDEEIANAGEPALIQVMLQKGIALMGLEDHEGAIEAFTEALKIQPVNELVLFYLANSLETAGRYDAAIEYSRRIGEDSEFFLPSRLIEGRALNGKGDRAGALELFHALIEKRGSSLDDLQKIAYAMYRAGYKVDALNTLYPRLKKVKEEEKVPIYQLIATIHDEEGEYESAVSALRKALEIEPENTDIRYLLAFMLDKSGKRWEGVEIIKGVLEKEPENPDACNFLGYTYAEEGINLDEAERLIKKALEKRPEDGYITDSLGWIYFRKGEFKKAVEILKRAVKFAPDEAVILDHLGDALRGATMMEDALDAYRSSLTLMEEDPKRDENLYLQIKEKVEDLERALRMGEREKSPGR